jgi:hypothetical protein
VETDFIKPLLAQPDLIEKIKGLTPLGRLAKPEDMVGAFVFFAHLAPPWSRVIPWQLMADFWRNDLASLRV